jgi:phage terminase large subunit-like protein
MQNEYRVRLKRPHSKQKPFVECKAKRIIIRAGRRGGKTVGIAIYDIEKFIDGKRVLYAAPTSDQLGRWWTEVTTALAEPIKAGIFYKNETEHLIELPGTEQRIRGKTAWNADSLRGDYADVLTLDEWQLMDEEAWEVVGAPMLLDNDGVAIFIYTPPSLHSRSVSKARDPQHAAKMFAKAKADTSGRWATFHFTSHDNPHISKNALSEITKDMSSLAIRQEIMAEDINEAPGALWKRADIDKYRIFEMPEEFDRIVVGVDPSATSAGDEAGIIVCGKIKLDYYTIADRSKQGSPLEWAKAAVEAYHEYKADCMVAEKNNGGEMVQTVIEQVDPNVNVKLVWASRGKATRAEPISAICEKGLDHHIGNFPQLEDELCFWMQGDQSPNRLDAKVWAMTELVNQGVIFA